MMSEHQSLARITSILRVVSSASSEGMRSADVASACDLHPATANRLIRGMLKEGLLRQVQSKRYALGPEIWALGNSARRSFDIRDIARSGLQRLAENPGDVSFLQVRSGPWAICLDRVDGSYPIRPMTLKAGERRPLGVGAGSLALLAALPDAEIAEILKEEGWQERYPTFSTDYFLKAVDLIRTRGYSLIHGDVVEGVCAMGITIADAEGKPIAALSCAAVQDRMREDKEPEAINRLMEEAMAISQVFQSGTTMPHETVKPEHH